MTHTQTGWLTIALITAFILLSAWIRADDYHDCEEYVEQTRIWKQDAESGVIEVSRRGWPEYLNEKCGERQ